VIKEDILHLNVLGERIQLYIVSKYLIQNAIVLTEVNRVMFNATIKIIHLASPTSITAKSFSSILRIQIYCERQKQFCGDQILADLPTSLAIKLEE
jgi:hypothetical protein